MTDRLPYFRTADRIQMLLNQLRLWSGTRWSHAGVRPNEMKCGVTGDCLFWVHVFKAIGALPESVEVPEYRRQEALDDNMQRLRDCIESTGRAQQVFKCPSAQVPGNLGTQTLMHSGTPSLPPFRVGDVLLFHNGTSGAHCGLVVKLFPTHFVHLSRNGLNEEPLSQAHWLDSLAYVYRLLEEEQSAQMPKCLSAEVDSGTPALMHSGTGAQRP